MIECPHCHTVVLPTTSGACPSCMKDTREPPDVRTWKIPIRKGCSMPQVCYRCGEFATRSVKVAFSDPSQRYQEDDEGMSPFFIVSLLFGFASFFFVLFLNLIRGFFSLLIRSAENRASTVSFRIRQCRSCACKGDANPHKVWFDEGEMDFVVHPVFADEFFLANPEFDSETMRWQS